MSQIWEKDSNYVSEIQQSWVNCFFFFNFNTRIYKKETIEPYKETAKGGWKGRFCYQINKVSFFFVNFITKSILRFWQKRYWNGHTSFECSLHDILKIKLVTIAIIELYFSKIELNDWGKFDQLIKTELKNYCYESEKFERFYSDTKNFDVN